MSQPEPGDEFSASDRIKQLNEIDKDVANLLQSAGSALKALANKPPAHADGSSSKAADAPVTLESQKSAFTGAVTQYFALLSSIDVRLRRQVYALEEANIILPETQTKDAQTSFSSTISHRSSTKSSIYVGQGALDVGSLNSRRDTVGKDMESELWDKARHLVEDWEKDAEAKNSVGDSMEIDAPPP